MRFLVAILQLLLLTLPTFASGMSAVSNGDSHLPACCRRAGAHHCMMSAALHDQTPGAGFSATPQRCPYCPKALPAAQHSPASIAPSALLFAQIVSHPASAAQTLAKLRIARDRSRQKRGPPNLT